jgi:hypothetical protein
MIILNMQILGSAQQIGAPVEHSGAGAPASGGAARPAGHAAG